MATGGGDFEDGLGSGTGTRGKLWDSPAVVDNLDGDGWTCLKIPSRMSTKAAGPDGPRLGSIEDTIDSMELLDGPADAGDFEVDEIGTDCGLD